MTYWRVSFPGEETSEARTDVEVEWERYVTEDAVEHQTLAYKRVILTSGTDELIMFAPESEGRFMSCIRVLHRPIFRFQNDGELVVSGFDDESRLVAWVLEPS